MNKARWQDARNYLFKLTWTKVYNLLLLVAGYAVSKIVKKSYHWGMPTSVSIEPTTSCNLRCPECPSGLRSFTRPTGMLQTKLFEQLVQDNRNSLTYLHLYFQGEPYLHPEFTKLIAIANKNKIYTATSTNAHYLDDKNSEATVRSGLDRLIVSIDGVSQESYEQYRVGGKLARVVAGTENLLKWKRKLNSKTPYVIFQFLVVRHNENEIETARKLAAEIGVDAIHFKTAQIYDYKNGSPLIPKNTKYSRYKAMGNGTYEIKNKLENKCWKMWQSCVVTWDGKVVPCCFDKDAKYTMGSLNGVSLREVWHSQPYQRFRNRVLVSRKSIDICENCTEGLSIFEN